MQLNIVLCVDKAALLDIIKASELLNHEKKLISTSNLALVLVHDLLFSKGIEAGDGPIKQAVLRHKTRLHSELVKLKVKKGVKDNKDLALSEQPHVGMYLEIPVQNHVSVRLMFAFASASIPRYVRINLNVGTTEIAKSALTLKRNLRVVKCGEETSDA